MLLVQFIKPESKKFFHIWIEYLNGEFFKSLFDIDNFIL